MNRWIKRSRSPKSPKGQRPEPGRFSAGRSQVPASDQFDNNNAIERLGPGEAYANRSKEPVSEQYDNDTAKERHESGRHRDSKGKESEPVDNDDAETDSNWLSKIAEALQPALKTEDFSAQSHGREDRSIPREFAEVRLLVQRYTFLVQKVSSEREQRRELESQNNILHEGLQKARQDTRAAGDTIIQQQADHQHKLDEVLRNHNRILEDEYEKHQEQKTTIENWYAAYQRLENELQRVQQEKEQLDEQYQQGHWKLQEMQDYHEVTIEQINSKHKTELEVRENKRRLENEQMHKDHLLEIERLADANRAKIEFIQDNHDTTIQDLEEEHAAEVEKLQKEQASRTQRLQKDWDEKASRYEADMKQAKKDYEFSEAKKKQMLSEAIAKLEAEKLLLRKDFEEQKSRLDNINRDAMEQFEKDQLEFAEQFKAREVKLIKTHAQEIDRLKRDIQSRNKAFVSRDNFTPVTDGGLKATFFDLVREVDNLSRLKWAFNNSPWTDDFLNQVTDSPKRLQKQILQDTIWELFFENIFCSPFRVFGTEGNILETQWNDEFGKCRVSKNEFYTWPEPNFGSEKWRYETMRSCQDILKTTTSAYDSRTKLREAYIKSLDAIQEKIEAPLKMVSDLDPSTTKSIRALVEKAAKAWILFGTQRCRIVVVMQDLKTETESKNKRGSQTESIELVIRPELKRIGDSDGGSLEKEQIVAGCEGEAKKIMYSDS